MRTYFHRDQSLHEPRTYFSRGAMRTPQELPTRTGALLDAARSLGFDVAEPEDRGLAPIAAVHSPDYLAFLQSAHADWIAEGEDWGDEVMSNIFVQTANPTGILAKAACHIADGSAPIGEHTYRAAYASAQCAIAGADAILGGAREAYALCRPPGHHARRSAAGGFCFLNNAAVAAARMAGRFPRVAVLDTDMHHGQGIQEIFYDRSDVYYVSIHGDPTNFYPVVAGYADEIGRGDGLGFNLNLPMPHGSPEDVFFETLDTARAALDRYAPDVLVLSLGFDIYAHDPQAKVAVSEAGFERLGRAVASIGLPTLIVQEGGYAIDSLGALSRRFFSGFGAGR
ncbi:histone deacetylase family protein [Methylobacterium sp. J-090]|uniref:histone deacetylase family protein n=1 Tax=Methylobacterium sp. J-090 TaxID=2836666 RepID=UPI001FB883A1|nr:histone deacetylase family protein [Methylobacterium sp. J-090]MCJ2083714.1 histone deacetylase family protein [Methylobacterium sp. J-090]